MARCASSAISCSRPGARHGDRPGPAARGPPRADRGIGAVARRGPRTAGRGAGRHAPGLFPDGRGSRGIRRRRHAPHRAAIHLCQRGAGERRRAPVRGRRGLPRPDRPALAPHFGIGARSAGRTRRRLRGRRAPRRPAGRGPERGTALHRAPVARHRGRGGGHEVAGRTRLRERIACARWACTPTSRPARCAWNRTSMAASRRRLAAVALLAACAAAARGAGPRAAADPAHGDAP